VENLRRQWTGAAFVVAAAWVGGCGGDGAAGTPTPDGGGAGAGGEGPIQGPPEPSPLGLTHRARVIELLPGVGGGDPFLDGPGLGGVEVCVYDHPDVPCVATDDSGLYTLRGLPTNAELALTFQKDGYFSMARPLVTEDASVNIVGGNTGEIGTGVPVASHPIPMLRIDALCPDGSCSFLEVHGSVAAQESGRGGVFILAGARAGLAVTAGSVAAAYTGPAPAYAVDPALSATASGGRAILPNLEPGVAVISFESAEWSCEAWFGGGANSLPSEPGSIRVPVLPGHTTLATPQCRSSLRVCGGTPCGENALALPSCCTTADTGKAVLCPGCGLTQDVCGVHLTFLPAASHLCFELDQPGALDPACPGYETQFGFREGCCTEEGFCGGLEPVIPLGCAYQPGLPGSVIRGAPCGAQPGFACGTESCSTQIFDTPPCCTAEGTGLPGDPLEFAGQEPGRCGTLVDGVCLQTSLPGVVNASCPGVEVDGSSRSGCCTAEGFCGSVDPDGRGCIYLPPSGKGEPCSNE
jgi:hypothetical protein